MPVQAGKQQEFACPFNDCNRVYPTKRLAAQHLSSIKTNDGDELHPINDDLWDTLKKEGYFKKDTRPGNLTVDEKKARARKVSENWRRENRDKVHGKRVQRQRELAKAATLAKRIAKIAVKYRAQSRYNYADNRYTILHKLFGKTQLAGGNDPLSILNVDNPVTDETFPMMVCIYLPADDWPKIISKSNIQNPHPTNPHPVYRLIDQMPGYKEMRQVQLMLHPDEGLQQQNASRERRGGRRGGGRGGGAKRGGGRGGGTGRERMRGGGAGSFSRRRGASTANLDDSSLTRRQQQDLDADFTITPDEKLNAHLNAAWERWKDVISSPDIENESFIYMVDEEEYFKAKSPVHGRLLELYNAWIRITNSVMNTVIPTGYSVLQLYHFVNNPPSTPPPDELEEVEASGSEEVTDEEIEGMRENEVLYKALKLKGKKKPGRRKQTQEDSDDSDDDHVDEEES
jgi:uncharacterized membrane protein YgcG